MKNLYSEYLKDAKKLDNYIEKLKKQRAFLNDVDEIRSMTKRIEVLTEEYCELIRDAKYIKKYLTEEELNEISLSGLGDSSDEKSISAS